MHAFRTLVAALAAALVLVTVPAAAHAQQSSSNPKIAARFLTSRCSYDGKGATIVRIQLINRTGRTTTFTTHAGDGKNTWGFGDDVAAHDRDRVRIRLHPGRTLETTVLHGQEILLNRVVASARCYG